MLARRLDQRGQFVGGKGAFDLEIADILQLSRHSGQQWHRQGHTADSGASCTMIGMVIAALTASKCSTYSVLVGATGPVP